ncbi:hypothetical protein RchiOBHm_Chr6g0259481 [Rosa chinensis]|uniref:Uncharacterized protein n=1 Tax=Rosa chinensis TaxID=74649 RepID=A0A2P6PMW9_ROSCH|nr:hypothetical protein RchiOBHm_Chr6g0259481 [Rosa chinensis]
MSLIPSLLFFNIFIYFLFSFFLLFFFLRLLLSLSLCLQTFASSLGTARPGIKQSLGAACLGASASLPFPSRLAMS